MTIDQLILYAENRLEFLNRALAEATIHGNLENMSKLEIEIADTEETLTVLRAA